MFPIKKNNFLNLNLKPQQPCPDLMLVVCSLTGCSAAAAAAPADVSVQSPAENKQLLQVETVHGGGRKERGGGRRGEGGRRASAQRQSDGKRHTDERENDEDDDDSKEEGKDGGRES